jgi:hypothetical protein
MASEHDILSRLPEAPPPPRDARQAAIIDALQRFEEKNRARSQGSEQHLRLTQQTASSIPPSRRSSIMPRARHLIAASLVAVLMSGSAAWLYFDRSPVQLHSTGLEQFTKIRPAPSGNDAGGGTARVVGPGAAGCCAYEVRKRSSPGYAPAPEREQNS